MNLAPLLLRVHQANTSYRSVSGTARFWSNRGVGEAVRRALAKEADRTHNPFESWQAVEHEWVQRFWCEPPERLRIERVTGPEPALRIVDGKEWWSYDPDGGAQGSLGDPRPFLNRGFVPELLDPAEVLGAFDLTLTEEVELDGRVAALVRGTTRLTPGRRVRPTPYIAAWAADYYDLWLDVETGVCLRVVAYLDGHPIQIVEITEVEFGLTIPRSMFVFEAPDGVEVVKGLDPSARVRREIRR